MLTSQYMLQDCSVRFRSFEKQLKPNMEMDESYKTKFYGIALDVLPAAEENYFCLGDSNYKIMKDEILKAMDYVKEAETVLQIKTKINELVDRFFYDQRNYTSTSISDFRFAIKESVTKYCPVDSYNFKAIAEKLNLPRHREFTIIDPRCRDAQYLNHFKQAYPNITTYGIDAEHYAASARPNTDRLALGSLVGSRISNDCFDMLLVEPGISWNAPSGLLSVRQEKMFLGSIFKYVRPRGLVSIVIPYFKMYKDICLMLSKYLDNVQVRKMGGSDYFEKGLVLIVGTRSTNKEPNEEIYHMLRKLHDGDRIISIHDEEKPLTPYVFANEVLPVEFFRGSVLDPQEMLEITRTSGCMETFWNNQKVEKLTDNVKQPLLPFNIGQIGLVLTSGCLDGIVHEPDGSCHLIKGRVSKKITVERDISDNNSNVEVNETFSNRVEINVMLPNGEFKILA